MPVIEANNLTKQFRRPIGSPGLAGALRQLLKPRHELVTSVNGVSFSIEPGERVAFLGPNGAGKSTTIKMLTGVLTPTSGSVVVCGLAPDRERVANARNIGAVFGHRTQLWWDLPVVESLRLLGDLHALPRASFDRNLEELVELLDLAPLLSVPTRNLSLGQRMRCELTAAFLHSPRVVYLDEPTIGLDLFARERIRRFILEVSRSRRTTVLLTTHDTKDVEEICTRLILIDGGTLTFDGPLDSARLSSTQECVVYLLAEEPAPEALLLVRRRLEEQVLATDLDTSTNEISIRFDRRKWRAGQVIGALTAVVGIRELRIEEPTIEHVVRGMYAGHGRG